MVVSGGRRGGRTGNHPLGGPLGFFGPSQKTWSVNRTLEVETDDVCQTDKTNPCVS